MKIDVKNLANLYAQTPEMFCLLSGPEHVFEFVNGAHIKVLGFDATGMAVKTAQPESVEIHDILDNVYTTGVTAHLHEIPVTVTDRLRYFNLTYAARRDDEGKINGVMILGSEITDIVLTKRAITAALEMKEIQRTALELTLKEAPIKEIFNFILQMVETQTQSDTMASILLLDKTGKHLLHGAAPRLPEEYSELIHGIVIGNNVGSCGSAAYLSETVIAEDIQTDLRWADYKEIAKKYNLRSCWSTPIISSRGKVLGTLALYHSIPFTPKPADLEVVKIAAQTAAVVIERQYELEKRLEAEKRLNLALVSGSIGFWDWNAKSGYTFLSETLMQNWGIDKRTFKNTLEECLDRIHPEDKNRVWSEIQESVNQKRDYDVEYRVVRPDGKIIWINAKGQFLVDVDGAPKRLSGITIDMTERRENEERLKHALKARDEFLSVASHELKTPLTSLKLQNQVQLRHIRRGNPVAFEEENVIEIAEMTDKQINRINRLIDDMLDVSRIRAGKLTFKTAPEELSLLVRDVVKRLEPLFEDVGSPLPEIKISGDTTGVWDRNRIDQVVTNLLTNAIKYGNGKEITISLRGEPHCVTLKVSDRGIGISEEAMGRIFNRFERAIDSNEVSGLGLGLYISHEIVRAHGGKIWAESKIGEGSSFFVELPRSY